MKVNKLLLNVLVLSVLALGIGGCTKRLGQFTAASSQNVRNLEYDLSSDTKVKAKGESCIRHFIIIPIGSSDDRIQRAMDDAIGNGHKKGLDGDLLVNVRMDWNHWYIPFIYGEDCVIVEGDLVKLKK